jgi:gamma-carbonic anhydrase
MIRAYRGVLPQIASSAYIDPSAQLIGAIEIGDRSSVWPNTTLRGDINFIRIGAESNIQDNTCVHVDHGEFPTIIGDRVTVGHSAMLHGCTVEDDCVIGIGAVVLSGARIRKGAVIAAGAVVPEGMEVPPGSLVMGIPGKVRREVTGDEKRRFAEGCAHYVELAQSFKEDQP